MSIFYTLHAGARTNIATVLVGTLVAVIALWFLSVAVIMVGLYARKHIHMQERLRNQDAPPEYDYVTSEDVAAIRISNNSMEMKANEAYNYRTCSGHNRSEDNEIVLEALVEETHYEELN